MNKCICGTFEMVCVCSVTSVLSDSCDPMNYSLPGSSLHGILQGRLLEWVAMPSFRGSSWPKANYTSKKKLKKEREIKTQGAQNIQCLSASMIFQRCHFCFFWKQWLRKSSFTAEHQQFPYFNILPNMYVAIP